MGVVSASISCSPCPVKTLTTEYSKLSVKPIRLMAVRTFLPNPKSAQGQDSLEEVLDLAAFYGDAAQRFLPINSLRFNSLRFVCMEFDLWIQDKF